MKNITKLLTYILLYSIAVCPLPIHSSYAADSSHGRIREMSSKKSQQLFNEIAINLLNGRERFVSLDNMVRILKDYKVVEFHSKDIEPTQEIILKEVAFRMLKQHYLPRFGDKIRIYKLEGEFLKDTGIDSADVDASAASIRLPVDIAVVKEKNELKTIYWANLVMQISTVIEKLWLKRIGDASLAASYPADEKALLQAVAGLRKKFLQAEDKGIGLAGNSPANSIVIAAQQKIEVWLKEGSISKEDVPVLVKLIMQYIVLSNPRKPQDITMELRSMGNIADFKKALLCKIKNATDIIRRSDPADYGALVMLQSLLNEVSRNISIFPDNSTDYPAGADLRESHHSA